MIRVILGFGLGFLLACLWVTRGPMHQLRAELEWCRADRARATGTYIPPADFSRKLH
jgi:hypothetical protein